jgi:large subunit ribosomal protein L25
LLELSVNGKSESVVIKDLQYDHLGIEMLHVDFARVSADERVTISVPIHLKGTAKGIKSGGVLEQPVHEIDIECAASKLVDHIVVNIADLDLNQSITVADLVLPEGAKAVADADTIVVHVIKPGEQEEESPLAEASASEPEVIRREKEADEAEE